MRNILLLSGMLFVLAIVGSCKSYSGNKQGEPAKELHIISLEALDISENLTAFSTKQDEILFVIHQGVPKVNNTLEISLKDYFSDLEFNVDSSLINIRKSFPFPSDRTFLFSLVELDDYDSEPFVMEQLQEHYSNTNLNQIDIIEVDTLLNDDDFLGMKKINSNQIKKGEKKKIIFKGSHLFDKYEYHLLIEGL